MSRSGRTLGARARTERIGAYCGKERPASHAEKTTAAATSATTTARTAGPSATAAAAGAADTTRAATTPGSAATAEAAAASIPSRSKPARSLRARLARRAVTEGAPWPGSEPDPPSAPRRNARPRSRNRWARHAEIIPRQRPPAGGARLPGSDRRPAAVARRGSGHDDAAVAGALKLGNRRRRLHEIVFEAETPAGRAFDIALLAAIVVSVTAVVLESVESVRREYGPSSGRSRWSSPSSMRCASRSSSGRGGTRRALRRDRPAGDPPDVGRRSSSPVHSSRTREPNRGANSRRLRGSGTTRLGPGWGGIAMRRHVCHVVGDPSVR